MLVKLNEICLHSFKAVTKMSAIVPPGTRCIIFCIKAVMFIALNLLIEHQWFNIQNDVN